MPGRLFQIFRKNMAYRLIISENANTQIENVIRYVSLKLFNPEEARHILQEIDHAYDKLEERAESYAYCSDSYLASKGYRKLQLDKHAYMFVYLLRDNEVFIAGFFHIREDYAKKL